MGSCHNSLGVKFAIWNDLRHALLELYLVAVTQTVSLRQVVTVEPVAPDTTVEHKRETQTNSLRYRSRLLVSE